MKRKICLILALALAVSMTACGGDKNDGGSLENNKFSIMGAPAYPVEKDTDTEKWIEEKYGIELEVYSVTTSYYDKLATMLASNEVPDVMFINEPENWQPLVSQGFLAEVPVETIKQYAPRHYDAVEKMDPNIWAITKVDGDNWAVPKISDKEYGTGMVWRKDWLKNVGITKMPETIDEYEEAYTKMRENDPDGNGQKDTYGLTGSGGATQRQFDFVFGAFGVMPGQWKVVDGKVETSTTSEKARDALALLHKWYESELIDPEMITDAQDDHLKKFLAGRVGSFNTAVQNVSVYNANGVRNKNNFEAANPGKTWEDSVGVGSLPVGANGDRGDWLWGPRTNFIVFGEQMEGQTERMGKILSVFDDINYDEETALKVIWGEKGVTYDYVDESVGASSGLKYLPPYDSDTNARAAKGIHNYFNFFAPSSSWADSSISDKYTDPNLIKEQEEYTETDKYKDELMRPYLPSSSRYQSELDKLKTSAYSEFITGKRSLEDWDAFVEEYMRKGGQQLLTEAQEFYETNVK